MKLRIFNQSVFVIAAVLVFGTISCSKEIDFDKEKYTKYRKYVSPVDSVDQSHTWQLATSRSYQFTVNANVGTQKLEIYSEDPTVSTEAEMMSRVFVKDGQQVTLLVYTLLVEIRWLFPFQVVREARPHNLTVERGHCVHHTHMLRIIRFHQGTIV